MATIKAMLAETAKEPFDSPDHIFEWKWNGMRILAVKENGVVRLQGRSGGDYTSQFPELADLAKNITPNGAIIDGEVVCMGENGLPVFNRLQQRIGPKDTQVIQARMQQYPATFMVFDVLRVEDFDLTAGGSAQANLMQRKEILQKVLVPDDKVKLSTFVDTNGKALHQSAVELKQEGVMAKTKSGLYYPGGRNQDWLKLKVPKFENLVICGWTAGTGWRVDRFGAVILARRVEGKLVYVGSAGSGFTQKDLDDMWRRLQDQKAAESPFETPVKVDGFVSWVRPVMVANIKYYDTTKTGQLIWPIFQNLLPEGALA